MPHIVPHATTGAFLPFVTSGNTVPTSCGAQTSSAHLRGCPDAHWHCVQGVALVQVSEFKTIPQVFMGMQHHIKLLRQDAKVKSRRRVLLLRHNSSIVLIGIPDRGIAPMISAAS